MEDNDHLSDITLENFPDLEEVHFVKRDALSTLVFHFFGVVSLGLVYLAFYWKSLYYLLYRRTDCFASAAFVLLVCENGDRVITPILEDEFVLNPLDESVKSHKRFFWFAKSKYAFDAAHSHFYRLETRFARELEKREFYDLDLEVGRLGVDRPHLAELQKTFGRNQLEVAQTPVIMLVLKGLIHPLTIIIAVVTVICYLGYKQAQALMFASYILLLVVFSVVEERSKEKRILEMTSKESLVQVYRRDSGRSNPL